MADLPEENKNWYFDNSRLIFKIMRFLNVLEPDRCVLSMTKVLLWGTTIQSIMVISTSSDASTIMGALGINVAAMVKHEARRYGNKDDDKDCKGE